MKITMLGCGPSSGVPVVGDGWGACDPANPKNRRRRPSVLVEEAGVSVLVDTTPDLHDQLVDAGVTDLDAIIYTHSHADHVHGIDDVRPLCWGTGKQIPAYMDAKTWKDINQRFGYMFVKTPESPPHFRSPLSMHEIAAGQTLKVGPLSIEIAEQDHGPSGTSLGLVFNGKFAYSTDVAVHTTAELDRLKGMDVWIVDCLRVDPARSHANLDTAISWANHVKAGRTYFTHMAASLDYEATLAKCPSGVEPGYDGLVIEI